MRALTAVERVAAASGEGQSCATHIVRALAAGGAPVVCFPGSLRP